MERKARLFLISFFFLVCLSAGIVSAGGNIISAFWSEEQANTGDVVSLNVQTEGFSDGEMVVFEIIEDDFFGCSGNSIESVNTTLSNNSASVDWTVQNGIDGIGGAGGNLEYCFKAIIDEKIKSSENLNTLFGYEGWDCVESLQCVEGLICDSDGTGIGDVIEGCCYSDENWNGEELFCNEAVYGIVYKVYQERGEFVDSPYSNLQLRVFIEDEDLIEDDILWYFDVETNSNGEFSFNPERYIPNWNWDTLFVDYKINSIFAVDDSEIIGSWSNHFSNKPKFRGARERINQLVKVHADKTSWEKHYFPEVINGEVESLLTSEAKSLSTSEKQAEDQIFLKWSGKLKIDNPGVYKFKFNVSGDVSFYLNNKLLIDTNNKIGEDKEANVYLENATNQVYFEFYEKASSNPELFWAYKNGNLEKLSEEYLTKEDTEIAFSSSMESSLSAFSVISGEILNEEDDYMISFLESPQIIRNKNPLILVHGKHGTSGYWEESSIQSHLNNESNGGYDVWEFYYPGNDYINVSGALFGETLGYLKKNYYDANQKFNVISHSMGGLVVRSYVQGISPYDYKGDVNHLVMIGSPNYGNGAATGIAEDWNVIVPSLGLNTSFHYSEVEEWRAPGSIGSPIYMQMSLGSMLIQDLSKKEISPKSLVIIGNKDTLDLSSIESFFCSILDNIGHTEADPHKHDCLVAIASSSLVGNNIALAIIEDKNHATERDKIVEYLNLIHDFFEDSSDEVLIEDSFSYFNPQTGSNNNFFEQYNEGAASIEFLDKKIKNITRVSIKNDTDEYSFTMNSKSENYYHFNRGEFDFISCIEKRVEGIEVNLSNPLCIPSIVLSVTIGEPTGLSSCFEELPLRDYLDLCLSNRPLDYALTIPQGTYDLYVNGKYSFNDIEIKPAQTIWYELYSCKANWTIQKNWTECTTQDLQFKDWTDLHSCELNITKPERLNQTCDFCLPNWTQQTTLCLEDDYIVDWFKDVNNCYAQTNLTSDIDNKPENITHHFACDYDGDGFIGDISDVNTTLVNLSLDIVNGLIEIKEGNETIIEFDFNLTKGTINLGDLLIEKQSNVTNFAYLLLRGLDLTSQNKTKTIYLDRIANGTGLCIKDEETFSMNEISADCSGANETWIACPGESGVHSCNLTSNNTRYIVKGLKHSGVKEQETFCGDNTCNGAESCSSCSLDCGSCPAPQDTGGGGDGGGGSSKKTTSANETNITIIPPNQKIEIPNPTNETGVNASLNETLGGTSPVTGATIGTLIKRSIVPIIIALVLIVTVWFGVHQHRKRLPSHTVVQKKTTSKNEVFIIAQKTCPACDKSNSSWRRFCSNCGSSLR